MRRLRDKHLVPPEEFRFTHETGHTTTSPIYDDWITAARDHRRANGLDTPPDLEARMQEQLCGLIPPEYCERDPGDTWWVNTRFNWADFREGMQIFTTWAGQNRPLVGPEEANRRAALCVTCPLNVNIAGCAACHKIASYITGAVAKQNGAYDDQLKACAICHCALRAMTWFPLDLLETNETQDKQESRPDFCWLKKDGENYVRPA